MAQTLKFDLAKRKGCSLGDGTPLASFKMRETDGRDEENAAQQAKAKGGCMTALEEQIRLSLVEVNGEAVNVGTPYLAYDSWNSRARSFACKAYLSINGLEEKEATDFLASAVVCE